jgi:hypothetical protein
MRTSGFRAKSQIHHRSEIAKLFNTDVQKLIMPCQSWGMEKLRVKANLIHSKNSGWTNISILLVHLGEAMWRGP